jgi:hypothetical protein
VSYIKGSIEKGYEVNSVVLSCCEYLGVVFDYWYLKVLYLRFKSFRRMGKAGWDQLILVNGWLTGICHDLKRKQAFF